MNTPHRVLFAQQPLAQIAIALAIGILASNSLRPKLTITLCCSGIFFSIAVLALLRGWNRLSGSFLLLTMVLTGATLERLREPVRDANSIRQLIEQKILNDEEQVSITGVISTAPEFARDRVYLTIKAERLKQKGVDHQISGEVSLFCPYAQSRSEHDYRQLQLTYGTRIEVTTLIRRTDQFRNPGVSTLTEFLDRRGLEATGLVKSPQSITRVNDGPTLSPMAWLYLWREKLQYRIDTLFSEETAGVLDAALLGNRYNLSRSVSDRFREGGTFHVLVISGLHISFLGGVTFLLLRRITGRRSAQFFLSTLIVWGYSLMVGAESSVVRATLMFTFVMLAKVLFRSASSVNAVGLAAVVLLVRDPLNMFDPSFQLTFLSVLAIVLIAWPILQRMTSIGSWRPTRSTPYPPACSAWLKWFAEVLFWSEREWQKDLLRSPHKFRLLKSRVAARLERYKLQSLIRYVFGAAIVSLSVQVVLLPFLIVYFHRLSISSVILNVWVSLLLAALAVAASVGICLAQISMTVATPAITFANGLNWMLVHSVDPFVRLKLSSLRLPEYSGWLSVIYVVYYLPLLALMRKLGRWSPLDYPGNRKKARGLLPLAIFELLMIGLVVVHPGSASAADGKLHLDFLDVGQGDCALLTMPDGTTLLVDGGGRPTFFEHSDDYRQPMRSIGEMVVAEYLWWRGLDRVDYVLVTHADADHIDGLNDIVRDFSVRAAFVARTPPGDPEYKKFSDSLKTTGVPLQILQAGDVLEFGEVAAGVLWPQPTNDVEAASENDDSIVLRLRFRHRTILLTGDIERKAESAITDLDIGADVVKVPHHGSRTSSTLAFVNATHPVLAIISVGQKSMFGHPHKDVVERWLSSGAQVLTTGDSGTISVTTDGNDLLIKKYVAG